MAGRILILDDQATNRLTLRVKLAEARYEVAVAASLPEAVSMLSTFQPDLVIANDRLRDVDATDLLRKVQSASATALPILLVSGDNDPAKRVNALMAGAEDILARPFASASLMARVRSLLRARETGLETARRERAASALGFGEAKAQIGAEGRIALVLADKEVSNRWRDALCRHLQATVEAISPDDALDDGMRDEPADVFVIDADLPRPGGGLTLLADLRSRPGTRHAAMIFAHHADDARHAASALDLGANDLFSNDARMSELALRLTRQLRRKREADRLRGAEADGLKLAMTDPLTGLYNRRYALTYLASVARDAEASGKPFAVMVADLDHFKGINDRHGHAGGDAVLTTVARTIREGLRGCDMVARIGGEEFLVVMPDTDFARARPAAERLCGLIAETPVRLPGKSETAWITVSIGVAIGGTEKYSEPSQLVDHADRALYRAKEDGRNRVDMFRPAA